MVMDRRCDQAKFVISNHRLCGSMTFASNGSSDLLEGHPVITELTSGVLQGVCAFATRDRHGPLSFGGGTMNALGCELVINKSICQCDLSCSSA